MEATIIETKYTAPKFQKPYQEVTYYGWDKNREFRITVTEPSDTWARLPDITSRAEITLKIKGEILNVH